VLALVPLAAAAPPTANPDSYNTPEDTTLDNIDVTSNDTDDDPPPLTIIAFTQPTAGTGTVSAGTAANTLKYVPPADFFGVASFTYTVQDTSMAGETAIGNVTVTVDAVNDPPVAVDDTMPDVVEDTPTVFDPRTNDTVGPPNESVDELQAVSIGAQPANGDAAVHASGGVTYTPDPNYFGPDSFTYTVCDNGTPIECDTATVSVTVTPVNDAPVAVDDAVTVTAAGATFDVRTNDAAGPPNEPPVAFSVPTIGGAPPSGLTVNGDGTITYLPPATVAGNVLFTYEVCEAAAPTLCDQAAVTLEVLPRLSAADATVIEGDSGSTPATLQVSLNAVFTKTVTVAYATANSTAMSGSDYQAASGTLTFAPGDLVEEVTVNVVGDPAIEMDETFFLDLSSPTNATIADARGAATIRNDDSEGCDITGTPGRDRLVGTAASETICGLGGNDSIEGGGGDDIISGGGGNDTIAGGGGNDTITGEGGNDRIDGGTGDDAIDGDAGNDRLSGGGGGDAIEGGAGNDRAFGDGDIDTIDGGPGKDVVSGGAGDDVVDGHGGNDRLFGDAGNDRVDGGAGSDRVDGGAGNDWVNGGAGSEKSGSGGAAGAGIFGGSGNDIVRGEGGDNVFVPGAGNDTVQGGGALDLVVYAGARSGVVVDLTRRRAAGDGRDNLTGVENVTGSRFADLLIGNSVANVLAGGAGNDRLFGRNGNDTLLGGPGNDVLRGEGGRDRCVVGPGGGSSSGC
jgi:Ca2+-binding RTX toxin-like protein